MTVKPSSIAAKFRWTTIIYFGSLGIRFLTSVALSRLLGPEILGVMVLAQSVRVGAELLGDLGLEQNIIHSSSGNDESFLNTAWTMQIARGAILSAICGGLSPFLSKLYGVELSVMLAISLAPLFNSWASTSIFSLAKQLDAKRRNLFELAAEFIGFLISATLAFALGSVWAPVLGLLLTVLMRSALTYALPHPPHRLTIDRAHFRAIVQFGKWFTLSSAAFYAAIYIDRLFLGSAVSLAMLGIYGLARAISDLPTALAGRLGYMIVFPLVAANKEASADTVRAELAPARLRFVLLVAIAIATVMAWSDRVVMILYDHRYSQAGWMLFMLLIGSWIGVLTSLNDAVVIGRGRPQIASLASWIRIVTMVAMLPAGFALLGLPGAIIALPAAELARYVVLLVVQRSLRLGFAVQDAAASTGLLAILVGWLTIRWIVGLGMPWALMAAR